MLTQNDFDEIEKIIDDRLDEKIKFLPTKDEFFASMSQIMGELKAIREEQTVQSDKLSNHEDRIEKLKELQIEPQASL